MNYWQERMIKSQNNLTNKNIRETNKQLKKYYQRSMDNVITSFESTYDKLLTTIAEGKQPTPADLYKLDKYWEMQAKLKDELQKLGDKQVASLSKRFTQQYQTAYNSLPIVGDASFNTLDNQMAQQMINSIWCADGKSWSDRVWTNTDKLQQTLNDKLIECVVTGAKTTDLKKTLMEQFNVSYHRADSLVRTEMAHIQTQAAQQRYKDYGATEFEVYVDKDERTCPICSKLEGKRYSIHNALPVPAHPNCRCCIIPIVDYLINEKDYDNMSLQNYIDKPVSDFNGDDKTVRQWYYINVHNIPNKIDISKPLEAQAKQALNLRNEYKIQARKAMDDRKKAKKLNKEKPPATLEELLETKKRKYNLTGNDALKDIIRSASITNKKVDDIFL